MNSSGVPADCCLTEAAVEMLAVLQGYPPLEAEIASRVAVGVAQATKAIAAARVDRAFDVQVDDFACELERLADWEG